MKLINLRLFILRILLLLLTVSTNSTSGQQPDTAWVRTWDMQTWEEGKDIAIDDSINIYVAGMALTWGSNTDFIFGKYNHYGVLQWMKVKDYSSGDQAMRLAIGPDGYLYAGGFINGSYSTVGGNLCIMKYSTAGDSIWEYYDQNFSLAHLTDILFDSDGNIIVAGFNSAFQGQEYILMKLDTAGQLLWQSTFNNYGPNTVNRLTGSCIDHLNNIYVTGACDDTVNFYTDIVTIKFDTNGDTLWKRSFNGPGNSYDQGGKILIGDNGDIYTAGYVQSNNPAQTDYVLLRYDTAGNLIFSKYFNYPGPQSFDVFRDLKTDAAGQLYLLGNSSTNNAQNTIRLQLIKYNQQGDTIWTTRWGTGNDFAPLELQIDQAANLYICGNYYDAINNTGYNAFVVKFDSSGVLKWEAQYHDSTNLEELFYGLALDGNNDVITTGRQHSASANFDLLTVKYLNTISGLPMIGSGTPSALIGSYPNPLQTTGQVHCYLPETGYTTIYLYDIHGGKIQAIYSGGMLASGNHTFTFNPSGIKAGIYFLRLEQGAYSVAAKVVISGR